MRTRLYRTDKNFQIPHGTRGGYSNHKCHCPDCTAAAAKANREYNAKTGSGRTRARRFKGCEEMSELDCIKLLLKQGRRCAICSKELFWPSTNTHVDHDHKTGKIRGILCTGCNTRLGWFEQYSQQAKEYLR